MPRPISPLRLASLLSAWFLMIESSGILGGEPTLVVHHGKILTVDPAFQTVEAMAIDGERIVAIGSNEQMLALAGPQTERIDLQGRTVLPGLIDSHVHASSAAVFEFDHPVPTMESVADVLEYVRSRAAVVPKGQWIQVNQVFVTRLSEPRFPTRKELDAVAPEHPVCFRTGPDASLNSLALSLNQIDRNTTVPEGVAAKIERDEATGEPTGILRNFAKLATTKSSATEPDEAARLAALKRLMSDYNSVGITSIAERSASLGTVTAFSKLYENKELTCRVFLNWSVDPNAPWPEVELKVQEAVQHPAHAYNEWVWLRGVKIFLDGGMLTGSAYMQQPWGVSKIYSIDDPQYRGLVYVEPERLYQLARLCLKNDLQFTAHAVGDGAVQRLVDAYRQVNEEFPVAPTRPCITHANFMSQAIIDDMARLGIVADLQPAWLWLDGATLLQQFGEQRLQYFQPYRTLFDQQVIVGGGSDHMQKVGSLRSINPYNPFLGLWITLARKTRKSDQPLHPEHLLTREEALRLYTINNAFLLLDEQNRGSLEPGKLADFAVIDRDYMTCPVDQVRETQVLSTYVGGRCVYQAKQVTSPSR